MNVFIKTIPHSQQDYPTVGNWKIEKDGTIFIFVSKMNDWRYEFLVSVHELVEVYLCIHSGVRQNTVNRFDMKFEKNRPKGNTDEPGDDEKSPYQIQHSIASGVERILAAFIGVSWRKYSAKIDSL